MGLTDTVRDEVDLRELGANVPPGATVRLRGRGTTFVRYADGPPGAPTVVLVHGFLATGALNWFRCFEPMREHFNVVAPDMRGHGRGIRSARRFRLADCADDLAALIEQQQMGPVIAVGYSMGGPISQLLWRRHPHLVDGLVLVATGAEFVRGNRERYAASAFGTAAAGTTRLGAAASWLPGLLTRRLFGMELDPGNPGGLARWARKEMSFHSVRVMFEAIHAIVNYSAKKWIDEVDVPASVIVTENDSAVSPEAQIRMALAIRGAHISRIPDGHASCVNIDFGRKVTDACLDVAERIELGYRPLAPSLDPA
ncbi:MAG: alpha/beta hydrolase [Acidimicrobiia bacterium]|nr:alpha/beta hydrolase [Acidimicrobiia bacterium]